MVIYRPAIRSDWEKSMARAEKYNSADEMIKSLADKIAKDFGELGVPQLVPIKPYIDMEKETADERNGWLHTRLVKVKGYPGMGNTDIVLGFADIETFANDAM